MGYLGILICMRYFFIDIFGVRVTKSLNCEIYPKVPLDREEDRTYNVTVLSKQVGRVKRQTTPKSATSE